MEEVKAENTALREKVGGFESEERKRMEEVEERHRELMEEVKAENAALRERVGGLESEEPRPTETAEERYGSLIEELKTENAALLERLSGIGREERKRNEAMKAENAALLARVDELVSEGQKRIDAVKAENAALLAIFDELERVEKIPLPPVGLGILRFLKQRDHIVQITVSSHRSGSTNDLLTEDNNSWYSNNLPNSWIQWTISGGLKAIISSVKITGRPSFSFGVKDFIIEGSNDNAVWTTILDSKTCPTTIENFVTQAKALPQPQRPFSIIRLTQTGPRYRPPNSTAGHYLSLTYVDFGGRILFPATAK
jgi:hypothetical protein